MILLYNTVSRECTHNALAETNMSQLRERERVAGGRATMNSGCKGERERERESEIEINYFVFLFDDAQLKGIKLERN